MYGVPVALQSSGLASFGSLERRAQQFDHWGQMIGRPTNSRCVDAALASAIVQPAFACPDKPIMLIGPCTPGTSADLIARGAVRAWIGALGEQLIAESCACAADTIGGRIDLCMIDPLPPKPDYASGKITALSAANGARVKLRLGEPPATEIDTPAFRVTPPTAVYLPSIVATPVAARIRAAASNAMKSAAMTEMIQ
jgi:tripartite-type tricarboxylate transporter receptor subunit TctC